MAYKDPNYDPQKAHEYYEKHKKLKGRKPATQQQEQTAYVQAQLREQYNKANKRDREAIKDKALLKLEDIARMKKEQKEQLEKQAQQKIDQLKAQYENATPEQKKLMREKISGAILDLREGMKEKVGYLEQKFNDKSNKVRDTASKDIKSAVAKNKADYDSAVAKAKQKIKNG